MHLKSPRQERVIHYTSDGILGGLVFLDELGECTRAIGLKRLEIEFLGLCLNKTMVIEPIRDWLHGDGRGGDGGEGVVGGGDSGFKAF